MELTNKVFAYGFDALGFALPNETLKLKNVGEIEFVRFEDNKNLADADGVIIPQGIFEKIEYKKWTISTKINVYVYEELLLERQKQVHNLIREEKWVCFLVGQIIDYLDRELDDPQDIGDADLCKRILNKLHVHRNSIQGTPDVNAKENEFLSYIRDYGVAKTSMVLRSGKDELGMRVLADTAEREIVGLEFLSKLFFLPFHTTKRDLSTLKSILSTLTQAIIDYRLKRTLQVPAWTNEFKFTLENDLESEVSSLLEHLDTLQAKLNKWKSYKAILTASGDILKTKVIEILEDFFNLRVDPIDEKIEDAKIIDDQGRVLVLIEIKGTKKGIKREQINQVDSERERNELPPSTPAVLIINNEMSSSGVINRLSSIVPIEHIKHAVNFNVLIIRTIDLLFIMKRMENSVNRNDEILKLLSSGGGWLKANAESVELVTDNK